MKGYRSVWWILSPLSCDPMVYLYRAFVTFRITSLYNYICRWGIYAGLNVMYMYVETDVVCGDIWRSDSAAYYLAICLNLCLCQEYSVCLACFPISKPLYLYISLICSLVAFVPVMASAIKRMVQSRNHTGSTLLHHGRLDFQEKALMRISEGV